MRAERACEARERGASSERSTVRWVRVRVRGVRYEDLLSVTLDEAWQRGRSAALSVRLDNK